MEYVLLSILEDFALEIPFSFFDILLNVEEPLIFCFLAEGNFR